MRKYLVSIGMMMLFSTVPAQAQSNIVSYDLLTFSPSVNTTTGSPIQTTTMLVGAFVCNQTKLVVSGTVVNPTQVAFDDPAAPATKDCIAPLASTVLIALPNGVGYKSVLVARDNLGQLSVRSAASNPFDKQGNPSVPTGLRIIP